MAAARLGVAAVLPCPARCAPPRGCGGAALPHAARASYAALAPRLVGARVLPRRAPLSSAGARADLYSSSNEPLHQTSDWYVDLCPGFAFFKVEAVVRPWRLSGVVQALSAGGIRGVTAYEVKGLGAQGGSRERYNGHEFDEASLVDKAKVEVVVVANQVNDVVNIIINAAQTGMSGDGKVFISPVSDVIRIRTAEHGAAAERMKGGREDMFRMKGSGASGNN